jgi:hypothetical protein
MCVIGSKPPCGSSMPAEATTTGPVTSPVGVTRIQRMWLEPEPLLMR